MSRIDMADYCPQGNACDHVMWSRCEHCRAEQYGPAVFALSHEHGVCHECRKPQRMISRPAYRAERAVKS